MDLNLEFNTGTQEVKSIPASSVHYMPCSVEYDGEAAINSHFMKYIKPIKDDSTLKTETTEFSGSFRGYPLRGESTVAPRGYSFVLMKEVKTDEVRTLKEKERFDRFIHWNVSTKPGSGDPFHQTIRWIDVANIIHAD